MRSASRNVLVFYFYVDYEKVDSLSENTIYFHANWRRDMLTDGKSEEGYANHSEWEFGNATDKNTDGAAYAAETSAFSGRKTAPGRERTAVGKRIPSG